MISLIVLLLLIVISLCSSSLTPSLVSINLLEIMSLTQLEMFIKDMGNALELFDKIHGSDSNRGNNGNNGNDGSSNTNNNNNDNNRKLSSVQLNAIGDPTAAPTLSLLSRLQDYEPKTALKNVSESCNQQLCQMYESALSCKVLGIGLKKICAQYITSFVYDCSSPFPPFYDIYQAPYYCIVQIKTSLAPLISGLSGKGLGGLSFTSLLTSNESFLNTYINSNFSENCRKNCYQTYLNASISFYSDCYPILYEQFSTVYKLPFQLDHFQELREQICVEGDNNQNCYDQGRDMLQSVDAWIPSPAPTVAAQALLASPPLSDIHLYDPQCTYIYELNNTYGFSAVNSTICGLFDVGNCYGNIVNMISTGQLQSNGTALTVLPPCLLKFLDTNCNKNISSIATTGASTSMAVFNGFLTFESKATYPAQLYCPNLPNVYDKIYIKPKGTSTIKNGFLGLQGAIEHSLLNYMLALDMNYSVPLSTFITNFEYHYKNSAGNFVLFNDNNGVPPLNPRETIYNLTTNHEFRMSFNYSIFAPNLNSSMVDLLIQCATNPFPATTCHGAYSISLAVTNNFCGEIDFIDPQPGKQAFTKVANYAADPFITTKNSATSSYHSSISIIAILLLIIYYAL